MKKHASETRQLLLDVARDLVTRKGYTAVGIAEIVAAAGIPKGSFYYYFPSKEDFGQAVLQEYFNDYLATVNSLLSGHSPAIERLIRYFRYWQHTQGNELPHEKCLVVKLGAEVSDISEGMREVLNAGTQRIVEAIRICLSQGKEDGSVKSVESPDILAPELYKLWLGASLMVKVNGNAEHFSSTLNMTVKLLS